MQKASEIGLFCNLLLPKRLPEELTLNQVAYKLGFQYPQHFTRLFKKEVGMTSSEYRN